MRDGTGVDLLYFLRHDADIEGAIAALVAEAIELETVAKPHQRGNVLLEADVGTPPPAAATAAAAATSTAAGDVPAAAATSTAAGDVPAAARTAFHARAAATFERLGTSPARPFEVRLAAIAEARLPTLGEVFRLWPVAKIEGVPASGPLALRLRLAEVRLLSGQVCRLAGAVLQSFFDLTDIGPAAGTLALAAKIGAIVAAGLEVRLLPACCRA